MTLTSEEKFAERVRIRARIRKWTRIMYLLALGMLASIAAIGISVLMMPTGASPDDLLGKVPLIGLVVFTIALLECGHVVGKDWDRLLGVTSFSFVLTL